MLDYKLIEALAMAATPEFVQHWFARGITLENLSHAPLVIFNQNDHLHDRFFRQGLSHSPSALTVHYLPSTEKFMDFISDGLAYGMLPDQQCAPALSSGRLEKL